VPIYEYACKKCNHTMDALQKITDEPLVKCPECGEPELRRLLSAPRFRLKGDGWYETDFKKKEKQRNVATSDEPPKEKADKPAKSDSAAETPKEKPKPAAKPAAVAKPAD
jgi:putative FmdB family regulatory protein